MIYKLKLIEMLVLKSILPQQGNYETLIIAKDLQEKTTLTQEQLQEFEVKTVIENEKSMLKWNEKGRDAVFDIDFKELETKLIKEELTKLEQEKKLGFDILPLYKKFVLNEQ